MRAGLARCRAWRPPPQIRYFDSTASHNFTASEFVQVGRRWGGPWPRPGRPVAGTSCRPHSHGSITGRGGTGRPHAGRFEPRGDGAAHVHRTSGGRGSPAPMPAAPTRAFAAVGPSRRSFYSAASAVPLKVMGHRESRWHDVTPSCRQARDSETQLSRTASDLRSSARFLVPGPASPDAQCSRHVVSLRLERGLFDGDDVVPECSDERFRRT
jgi:hypothetical protein